MGLTGLPLTPSSADADDPVTDNGRLHVVVPKAATSGVNGDPSLAGARGLAGVSEVFARTAVCDARTATQRRLCEVVGMSRIMERMIVLGDLGDAEYVQRFTEQPAKPID